jgi:hypothetical protein
VRDQNGLGVMAMGPSSRPRFTITGLFDRRIDSGCRVAPTQIGKTRLQGSTATFVEARRQTRMKYCLDCGFVGQPEQYKPGTFQMELGLWLLFLVPGVIYSVWRLSARYQRCAKCGNKRIVPTDSPVAQAALRRLSPPSSPHPWVCTACGEPIFRGGSFCERCQPRPGRARKGGAFLQN